MLTDHEHKMHQQAALHDSTFFFVGPFDDNSFCRGPQVLKPISTHFTSVKHFSKPSALATPPLSDSEYEDYAVLGDDDEHSEDELPPSPRRRHSGAMSISSEDLPFCYDRDALRRDTAAHRARHLEQMKALKSRGHVGTFAAHETWDSELDGPHMALWVPKSGQSSQESKRRRLDKSATGLASSTRAKKQPESPQQVEEIDGPMMALWGI
ncbi:hypothetical protein N0V93_009414 [Gnomoniopsis smithogilvyi]|uniref:Uncharacterized protein n=1 Tax=Gnomoniopsis smithogilvyi TaxID=1191159 RepID=A0A9W9CTN7_9PEZI|nr:hypothetical protein N0V93_009414 [Gnomoniopsis smithogilvyi]